MKKQVISWKNIFANCTSNRGPVSRMTQIFNMPVSFDPVNCDLGIYSREITHVHTKALDVNVYCSFIHNGPKLETTQMSFWVERLNQLSYNHTIEYNSALKKNKLLAHIVSRELC